MLALPKLPAFTLCQVDSAWNPRYIFQPLKVLCSFRPFTHPLLISLHCLLCSLLRFLLSLMLALLACLVLFLLPYSSMHGPLRPPVTAPSRLRPAHAHAPATPHAAPTVTCPDHTTGPAPTRRPISRRTRPLTWSRSHPARMRSRPLLGPARTRSPRRSHSPCCPPTRPMVAHSPRQQHAHPLLLRTPNL